MLDLTELNGRLKRVGIAEQTDVQVAELLVLLANVVGSEKIRKINPRLSELNAGKDFFEKKAILKQLLDEELEAAYQAMIQKRQNQQEEEKRQLLDRLSIAEDRLKEKEEKLETALKKVNENEKIAEVNATLASKNAESIKIIQDAAEMVQKNLKEELERQKSLYEKIIADLKSSAPSDVIPLKQESERNDTKEKILTPKPPLWKKIGKKHQKELFQLLEILKQEQTGIEEKRMILEYYKKGIRADYLQSMIHAHLALDDIQLLCDGKEK